MVAVVLLGQCVVNSVLYHAYSSQVSYALHIINKLSTLQTIRSDSN